MSSKGSGIAGVGRLMSVDALRGFDMFWIIGGSEIFTTLAKGTGSSFLNSLVPQLDHEWGVFHFYDLIMPLFLFIVGVVMPFSFNKRLQRGDSKKQLYSHIIKRVLVLWILGLIASGNLLSLDLSKLHLWTDTLHAIAIGYLFASIIILSLNIRWQIAITAALLLLYWAVMALVPVPGYGAGMFTPDVNLAIYVDNLILGHFQEGMGWTYILTNMTFICSVMLGCFAGQWLHSSRSDARKVMGLALAGIICLVGSYVWGFWFPIIHHLWTSTLVLFATGWSCLLLALFYLVIDVWGFKKWSFGFVVIGMNAIVVYTASHLFDFKLIGNVFVGGLAKWLGQWNDFVQTMAAFVVVWLILYWMYRKKSFVKI